MDGPFLGAFSDQWMTGSWRTPIGLQRASIDYLDLARMGPFVANVLADAGQPVVYEQQAVPLLGDLGIANPSRIRQRSYVKDVPYVPLSETVRAIVGEVETSTRLEWHRMELGDFKMAPGRLMDRDI